MISKVRALCFWGDPADVGALQQTLVRMLAGDLKEAVVGGNGDVLTLRVARRPEHSHITTDGGDLLWECSIETLQKASDLVGPPLTGPGHQYIDASGAAEQVIVSVEEYPKGFAR
jgi:hypothetical protein